MDKRKLYNLLSDVLSQKELSMYLAATEKPSSVAELAQKINIDRVQAYALIKSLCNKGLLAQEIKNHGRTIVAEHPKKLKQLIGSKQRKLRRNELELDELIPELLDEFSVGGLRPRARFYEGVDGYLSMFEESLSEPADEIVHCGDLSVLYHVIGAEYDKKYYIPKRIEQGTPLRMIVYDDPDMRTLKKRDSQELRETRILSKEYYFSSFFLVYGDHVAISTPQNELMGIGIKSKSLSMMFKQIFEMIWNIAK